MNGWAKGYAARYLAPIAAICVMLLATPILACDTTTGCPAGGSNTANLPANMLPTYADATQPKQKAAAPINLKKFTKKKTRAARRASSRKAAASKASRSKQAARNNDRNKIQSEAARDRAEPAKVTPALANANAELTDADAAATDAAGQAALADTPPAAASTEPAAASQDADASQPAPETDVVSAEDFNEVDGSAWDGAQPPRLMQLT